MTSIQTVTASGFLSIQSPVTIDLSVPGVTELSGSNGAGKTSIMEAVSWCLFGSKSRPDIINSDSKSASVAVSISTDKGIIDVARTAKRTKTGMSQSVTYKLNGQNACTARTAKEKNDQLAELLAPLTAEVFASFFKHDQGGTFEFFTATPLMRHRTLTSIHPGLSGWSDVHAEAKSRKKELTTELTRLEAAAENIVMTRDDAELELEAELSEWDTDPTVIVKSLDTANNFSVSPKSLLERHEEASRKVELIQEQVVSIEDDINGEAGRVLDEAEKDFSTARDVASIMKSLKSIIAADSAGDRNTLSTVSSGVCPTCGNEITDSEHIVSCIGVRENARSVADSFYMTGLRGFVSTSQSNLSHAKSVIDEMNSEADDLMAELADEQEDVLSPERIAELRDMPEPDGVDKVAVVSSAARVDNYRELIEKSNNNLADTNKNISEVSTTLNAVSEIFDLTGEKGLPAKIAAEFASNLESAHNDVLSSRFNMPDISVKYGGDDESGLAISASIGGGDYRDILSLSGGERAMVVVSGAFAMAEAAKSIGVHIDNILLDEPFNGLDGDNIGKISNGVIKCSGENGIVNSVLLVSHSDYTSGTADVVYDVVKNHRGSVFSLRESDGTK